MEAFLVEMICKPGNSNAEVDFCHASICAIAESESLAQVMAQDMVLSHGYIVEEVLGSLALNSLPKDEVTPVDMDLYHRALNSELKCAGIFVAGSEGRETTEIHALKNLTAGISSN